MTPIAELISGIAGGGYGHHDPDTMPAHRAADVPHKQHFHTRCSSSAGHHLLELGGGVGDLLVVDGVLEAAALAVHLLEARQLLPVLLQLLQLVLQLLDLRAVCGESSHEV